MSDIYIENAEAHLQALRTAYFPWSPEQSTLAANVIRSLIDERAAVEALHRPKRGETARYASDDWEHEGEPTHFEPYVICAGDGAAWPCRTARALGHKPTESG